jgi:putative oxidoreductase
MSSGLLLLRLVLGVTLMGHGSQKLFGVLGGLGPRGEREFLEELGFRAPATMAFLLGFGELVAGAMFAAGFLIPAAGLALAVFMINAIATALRPNGYWVINGGYEYAVLIWTVSVAVSAIGGGRFSLDAAIGWADNLSGVWWGVGVAGLSVVIAFVTLTLGRRPGAAAPGPHGGPGPHIE